MATKIIKFTAKELDAQTRATIAANVLIEGQRPVKWWARQGDELHNKFMREIATSLENGESTPQAAARISGGTVAGVVVPGIMDTARRNATTLARTAMNKITNEARIQSFEANADVVKALKQISTLDSRTSQICISYDGQVWENLTFKPVPPSKLPFNGGPPRHFNCRSSLTPVLKSFRELGIDIDEIPPSSRASMDGQVPADTTFNDFLKGKTHKFQNEVLGATKAKLWREGKITLQQMVDQRGRPLTAAQLQQIIKNKRKPKPKPPTPTAPAAPPTVIPEFANTAQAQKFLETEAVRGGGFGIGWLKSFDRNGLRVAMQASLDESKKFGLPKPRYIGDPKQHPTINYKWNNKHNAAVDMPGDSLLFKGGGISIKSAQKKVDMITSARYINWREKNSVLNQLKKNAEQYDDKALNTALANNPGNEWTVGERATKTPQEYINRTFTHETGHRFHQAHLKEINDELQVGKPGGFKDSKHRYLWMRQTSEYAKSNNFEFVAEQFVMYTKGIENRVFPPLLKIFKKYDRS